ncbi:RHS repeat-associated core domain-containing protein [Arcobacter sp. YIC-80]|uniref:RHS repeat-associated core domain-containing protein n=1 Tax=Arcobacter sp. YIC-80 TaxID=3376683 RepID=UPI00384D1324
MTNSYVYGEYIDDVLAYTNNSNTYYYIKDRQYSIKALVNSNGDVVERYSYSSFGKITIKNSNNNVLSKSKYNNTITYTGRRYDVETDMYYYRNRMYSADLGRFISKDPKGYVDGMNLYTYVMNNPLKYLDPMGTTAYEKFEDEYGRGTVSYSISGDTDSYNVTYEDNTGFGKNNDYFYSFESSEVRVKENNSYFGIINDISYSFEIKDSHLPQDERSPDRLTAHVAYRPLMDVLLFGENNPIDEKLNTVIAHEHIWWNDLSNIGFHKNDAGISEIFREEDKDIFKYTVWKDKEYEGNAMKQAVKVTRIGIYDLLDSPFDKCDIQNNCQDFVDRVDRNYNKMVNIYE